MNKPLVGALFAAVLAVAACAGTTKEAREKNPAPCPNILVLNDASRIIEFDGEQTLENVAYTGEITNVAIGCRYIADKPIDTAISIDMAFGRGPMGEPDGKTFTYFVAVTRKDLEVITKKEFTVPVEFGGRKTVVFKEEEIDEIIIPRAGENIAGTNFEIIVGFALTPQQAIFNRSGKSLKFPKLQ